MLDMSNLILGEKKFTLELIEIYKSLPALWNVNLPSYTDKLEKTKQYNILLLKFREQFPNGTLGELKRKINSLRTNYRREKMRVQNLDSTGAISCDLNMPNLYYFNEIQFLDDVNPVRSSNNSTCDELTRLDTPETPNNAKRKADATDKLIDLATRKFAQPDDSKKITDAWAVKLSRMSLDQRVLSEKFIEEILFEGQMGTLHRNSQTLTILSSRAKLSSTSSMNSSMNTTMNNSQLHQDDGISLFPEPPKVAKYFSSFK